MSEAIYSDSSFLVSLYVQDRNTQTVIKLFRQSKRAFIFNQIHLMEVRNAIRLCVFRKQISAEQSQVALSQLLGDLESGVFEFESLVWSDLLQRFEELSTFHTAKLGNRTLDILHVAAALNLKSKQFLTYDLRQAALAKKVGLKTRLLS